jgi:hypothetical protein
MSIMKLNLSTWLFHAWIHVKNMNEMICKGWEKIGLLRSFNMQFQLEVMEVNVITPLFQLLLIQNLNNTKRK